MSRLKDLLEAEIKYQNGRILTTGTDFLKDNQIDAAACAEAVRLVKASTEYKELIDEGFVDSTGPIQVKRATFFFKPNTNHPNWKGVYYEFTCFPTGLVRAATGSLGGKPYELKVEEPQQVTDKASHVRVMVANLIHALKACLEKLGKTAMQKVKSAENKQKEADRMASYDWPNGFAMYTSRNQAGWCKRFKDGTYQINVKEYDTLTIDMEPHFDKLPIEISEVRRQVGSSSSKTTDDYVNLTLKCKEGFNNFEGFPRNIKMLTVYSPLDWKAAAKYFSHIHELRLANINWEESDFDFPMMGILNLPGTKLISLQNYGGKTSDLAVKVKDILQAGVTKQFDEFDVQERLMDLGLKKAPR